MIGEQSEAFCDMKKSGSTFILVLIFIAGLAIFSYPMISDRWNSYHASRAITSYTETVSELDSAEYEQICSAAARYNRNLLKRTNPLLPSGEERAEYVARLSADAGRGASISQKRPNFSLLYTADTKCNVICDLKLLN